MDQELTEQQQKQAMYYRYAKQFGLLTLVSVFFATWVGSGLRDAVVSVLVIVGIGSGLLAMFNFIAWYMEV